MSEQYQYPFTPLIYPAEPLDKTGDTRLGYYATETTQRHVFGRYGITWDGKKFKYCHSLDTIYPGRGAFNGAGTDVSALINSVSPAAIVIGDRKTTITIASTEGYAADGAIAEDELAGANLVIGHGAAATTENRTVVGNTVNVSGAGTVTVWVDYPFAVTHAAGVACELPLNAYRYCIAASSYASVVGVANMSVTTGYNFWAQTWGPCWCVPGGGDSTPGDTASDRSMYFVGDGSVNGAYAIAIETGYQIAGWIMDGTESGTGCMPMVMLTIS